MAEGKGSGKAWIAGIIAAIIGGVTVWVLTQSGMFFHPPTPALAGEITEARLSETSPCCTFEVRAHLTGFQGKDCPLHFIAVNASTGREGVEGNASTFTAEAQDDTAATKVSIGPFPRGTYFVRFILYDSKGNELHRKETGQFNVY